MNHSHSRKTQRLNAREDIWIFNTALFSAPPFTHLFQQSLKSRESTKGLETRTYHPCIQKGDQSDPKSYHPVLINIYCMQNYGAYISKSDNAPLRSKQHL